MTRPSPFQCLEDLPEFVPTGHKGPFLGFDFRWEKGAGGFHRVFIIAGRANVTSGFIKGTIGLETGEVLAGYE